MAGPDPWLVFRLLTYFPHVRNGSFPTISLIIISSIEAIQRKSGIMVSKSCGGSRVVKKLWHPDLRIFL